MIHNRLPLAAVLLSAGLLAPAPALCAGESAQPRIVPMPAPPAGPQILSVRHDAGMPITTGTKVRIVVRMLPGARVGMVSAEIGALVKDIPCAPDSRNKSAYMCEAVIPPGGDGSHVVRARAAGKNGRESSLSAPYPVVVRTPDPEVEINRINARMQTIYFEPGSQALGDAGLAAVRADAKILLAHPGLPVQVEGHGDSEEGAQVQNLSASRAKAVLDELIRRGVPKDRMTAVPFGATQPVSTSDSAEKRALNRRVLVLVDLPPVEPPK